MSQFKMDALNINSIAELDELLSRFQINTTDWLKDIKSLYNEIKKGDSLLGVKEGELIRRVNGVVIKCFYTNEIGETFQLIEERQIYKSGQTIERGLKFIAEKIQTGETPEQGALRGLKEELGISGPNIQLLALFSENRSDVVDAPDYKGLSTLYNTHVFVCNIPDMYYKSSYIEDQKDKKTIFSWVKVQ